jgi:hypothetical protein
MITLTTPEGVSEKFHMEIEFDPDSTLVLRVFRYFIHTTCP